MIGARLAGALVAAGCVLSLSARRAGAQPHDIQVMASPEALRAAAGRAPAPLWRLPLGAALIEDMQAIDGGGLLVLLREDAQDVAGLEHVLIAEDSGKVRWRRASPKSGDLDIAAVLDSAIVFHARPGKDDELTLVDIATGEERWKVKAGGAGVNVLVLPEDGRLLITRRSKKAIELRALRLADGRDAWKRTIPGDSSAEPPILLDSALLSFAGGVTRLAAATGEPVWTRPCGRGADAAPPVVQGGWLFLTCDSAITALSLADGQPRWAVPTAEFASVTSVYVDGDIVILRGLASPDGRARSGGVGAFLFGRYDAATGARRWLTRTAAPTVSNVVRAGARMIAATPRAVVAFDTANGQLVFETPVDQTGRAYPVRLRGYPDRVVYIGEVAIAAVTPDSGRLLYRHGLTPVSQEASLTQLDGLIPRLEAQVAAMNNRPVPAGPGAGAIALSEVNRYQQMSNLWRSQEDIYRMRGDPMMRDYAAGQSRRAARQAERMNNIALAASLLEIGLRFYFAHKRRVQAAVWEGFLRREMLFRRSIVAAHQLGFEGDYVVRPELSVAPSGDALTSVAVIHLPTGQKRTTVVSANYQSYGLWNRFDPGRRVVFHQGIGLDPSAFEWSEPRKLWPHDKARTVRNYLIAVPVRVP